MSENIFRDTAQHVDLSPLDCICGHTFALVYLVPVENEEKIQRSFYACKTIHNIITLKPLRCSQEPITYSELRERDHLENPGIDRRVILKWIFRKWDGGKDWIDVVQKNRDGWQALVNAVMNLWRISWLAENLLSSQSGICSMELV
jgi:hypothetical protein